MDPGGNVGIGNYKGVMLCNRPFGGVASSKKEASANPMAKIGGNFRAGKVPDEIGLKPLRDFPKPMRFRKETALTKHKKWLVELQQTKDELEAKAVSRRYAGHQVQPKKTVALLKSRGWKVDYEEGLQKVYHKDGFMAKLFAMADWFSPADVESPTLETVEFLDRKT